jgi:hypothetical protein
MRNGEPAEGLKFYELLFADDNFCKELGRTVLSAGRLESILIQYINTHVATQPTKGATLGNLIKLLKKNHLLNDFTRSLETVKKQRDYLTHNLHALFSGLIEVTILERSGLLDSDIDLFSDRAKQLNEDMNKLAEIISKAP